MNKRMLGPIMMDLEGPVLQPHEAPVAACASVS